MSLVVYATRKGTLMPANLLGHVVSPPAEPTADSLEREELALVDLQAAASESAVDANAGDNAVFCLLGAHLALPALGKVAQIQPLGLHHPSPFEQRWLDWLGRTLGCAVLPPTPAPMGPFTSFAATMAAPLHRWPDTPPANVRLVEGGSTELEARGVARMLRERLLAKPKEEWDSYLCGVTILLPSGGLRIAQWRTALGELGVPVANAAWEPVAGVAVCRWIVALLGLAGWGEQAVDRQLLREVLLSPHAAMLEHEKRRNTRRPLRSLRRQSVSLPMWLDHVAKTFALARDRVSRWGQNEGTNKDQIQEQIHGLALEEAASLLRANTIGDALASPAASDFFARFHQLLAGKKADDSMRVRGKAKYSDHAHAAALEASLAAVHELALVAEALPSAEGATTARVNQLRDALAAKVVLSAGELEYGVRLMSKEQWDGTQADTLVLAGLEEGGWMRAIAAPSMEDAAIAKAAGLESAGERLEREGKIAALAAASATDSLILSWSQLDDSGRGTFRGPLLAGLRADGDAQRVPELWTKRCQRVLARDAVAAKLAEAVTAAEVAALDPGAIPASGVSEPVRELAVQALAGRNTNALLDQERAPEPGAQARDFGPWTGLVGVPLEKDVHSATSLESFGACGTQYFLGKVLRLSKMDDEDGDLSPTEAGSLIHAAMARATWEATKDGKIWDLSDPAQVDTRVAEATVHLDVLLAEKYALEPSLSAAATGHTATRWRRSLKRHLSAMIYTSAQIPGLTDDQPPTAERLTDEELDGLVAPKTRQKAAANYKACRRNFAVVGGLLPDIIAAAKSGNFKVEKIAKEWHAANLKHLGVGQGVFLAAARGADPEAELPALLKTASSDLDAAKTKLDPELVKLWRNRREHPTSHVLAAEWGFGSGPVAGETDPRSIKARFVLPLADGKSIALLGKVDRVDVDEAIGVAAVIDYKTGKKFGDGTLVKKIGQGTHVQLPAYGAAVQEGLPLGGATVQRGSLSFVRYGKQANADTVGSEAGLVAAKDVPRPGAPAGTPPVVWAVGDVLSEHLGWTKANMDAGKYPLQPRACPHLRSDDFCDFEAVCGVRIASVSGFKSDQPEFVVPPKTSEAAAGPAKDLGDDANAEAENVAAKPPKEPTEAQKAAAEAKAAEKEEKKRARLFVLTPAAPAPTEMTDDDADRPGIRDLTKNIVVAAGAGSGKTYNLVERYTQALRAGSNPENILAVTFTRKAAAEMRYRVRGGVITSDDPRCEGWLRALGGAPIFTLDAFCGAIVRALDPKSTIEVHADATGWSTRAAERLFLAEIEQEGGPPADIQWLLDRVAVAPLRAAIAALVTNRLEIGELEALKPDALVKRWVDALRRTRPVDGYLSALEAVITEVDAFTGAPAELQPVWDQIGVHLRERQSAVASFGVLGLALVLPTRLPPLGAFKNKAGAQAKLKAAALPEQLAAASRPLGSVEKLSEAVRAALRAPEVTLEARLLEEATTTLAALGVAARLRATVAEQRQEKGIYGYDDVLAVARALIRTMPAVEVAQRLPYHHIFVDEFQDTNREQTDLVLELQAKIGEAGNQPKLFVVGDVKQSIYRFRGAEVDVFAGMRNNPAFAQESLPVARRARPNLARAFVPLFAGLLDPQGPQGSPDPLAAVENQALAPRKRTDQAEAARDEGFKPCVTLLRAAWIDEEEEKESPPAKTPSGSENDAEDDAGAQDGSAAADAPETPETLGERAESGDSTAQAQLDTQLSVAELPILWLKNHWLTHRPVHDPVTGNHTKFPSTVVLVHSWLRAGKWGDALRKAGVPAVVQGGRGLLSVPEVAELFTVAEVLENIDDPLPFGRLLRGPLVGISDPGLYCLAKGYGLVRDASAKGVPITLGGLRWGGQLDAQVAITTLRGKNGGALSAEVEAAITGDVARLSGMMTWLGEAQSRWGHAAISSVLSDVSLASGWFSVPAADGPARARTVNLRAFFGLCDALEAAGNTTTSAVHELVRQRDEECDAAATAGDTDGADGVVITVVHQAKGLEWDYVVVPEPELFSVKDRATGFVPVRLPADASGNVEVLAGTLFEQSGDLFGTESGIAGAMCAEAARPAERAELRRQLYVAMTRAKEHLVLGGAWPNSANAVHKLAEKWRGRSLISELGPQWCQSGFEMIALALGAKFTDTELATVSRWTEGQEFAWATPTDVDLGAGPNADIGAISPERMARVLCDQEPQEVQVVSPSSKIGKGGPAQSWSEPAGNINPNRTLRPTPFGQGTARMEGTAVHRVLELCAGDFAHPQMPEFALGAVREALALGGKLGKNDDDARERAAWICELVAGLPGCNPITAGRLTAAAARGELFHEVSVSWLSGPSGSQVRTSGSIDVLWREAGVWHLLDYKAGEAKDEGKMAVVIEHYRPQVELYAECVRALLPKGETLGSYGLWMVKKGVVAGW